MALVTRSEGVRFDRSVMRAVGGGNSINSAASDGDTTIGSDRSTVGHDPQRLVPAGPSPDFTSDLRRRPA